MAGVDGNTIDHTSSLPDELLHEVFGYLLRDKLRVESVSRRFQRCVVKLMKIHPQPLVLETRTLNQSMNNHTIYGGRLYDALRTLGRKSKFNAIRIDLEWNQREYAWWRGPNVNLADQTSALLSVLLETECLDKVVSFECNCCPSQEILEETFAQCVKLSALRFDFVVRAPNVQLEIPPTAVLDLRPVLCGKALTQLDLKLAGFPQEQLVQLFHALKPQTLQKLSLVFLQQMPPLDLAEMVMELSTNAWAALQEIKFCWETTAHTRLAAFFESFALLLPMLNKCAIELDCMDIQPNNQFVAAMTSLFKSDRKITILSSQQGFLRRQATDCQVVAQIRQVQNVYPNMSVDYFSKPNDDDDDDDDYPYDIDTLYLSLSLDNGRFEEEAASSSCIDAHCVECHRFYPRLLSVLAAIARRYTDMHLGGYQLDRCRVDTVVEHLNMKPRKKDQDNWFWEAYGVEANGDLATIRFVVGGDDIDGDDGILHQYNITVDCGPCFSGSCIACVNVE